MAGPSGLVVYADDSAWVIANVCIKRSKRERLPLWESAPLFTMSPLSTAFLCLPRPLCLQRSLEHAGIFVVARTQDLRGEVVDVCTGKICAACPVIANPVLARQFLGVIR